MFLLTSKTAFAAYQRQKGYRCNPSRCCVIPSDIRAAFLNVHPCTFLTASFALRQNIASVWNHGHPCPFEKGAFEALLNMSSLGTSGIRAASECTSLYIFDSEFCLTSKHRFCLIPVASVPLLNVHPCQFFDASFLRSKKHRCCVELRTSLSVWEGDICCSVEHEFVWNQRHP